MHLHTGRTMDGPCVKTVPVVYDIFDISSSTGLGIEGYRTCWKDSSFCVPYFWRIFFNGARNRALSDLLERWIRKPHPRNESSKYAPTKSFWGLNIKPSTSCHWFLCFGTRPRHQTRAPWLGPPRLKKGKSNFFAQSVISYTLLSRSHWT